MGKEASLKLMVEFQCDDGSVGSWNGTVDAVYSDVQLHEQE